MRALPVADPGTPDHRSPTRYLLWLARQQIPTLTLGALYGVVWFGAGALMPAVIGRAVDAGLTGGDLRALAGWAGALLALGVLQAVTGTLRHRMSVYNWLSAAYRTVQVTVAHTNRLGATLRKRLATGEVVSIGTADIEPIGSSLEITARASGALVALVTVTGILLHASVPLGLVVLLGVPLLSLAVGLLIRPLHRRQQAYRDQRGALTTRAGDIVTGLRVLRGVGGEAAFSARYRTESQRLRAAGVRVARIESLLDAAQVLLPGLLLGLVVWLGARFAVAGQITPGQLVAFAAYAAFLVRPLRNITEALDKFVRGHVAARRVVRLLALEPELAPPDGAPRAAPAPDGDLVDPDSGVTVRPGLLTAVAAADSRDAADIADRLGRYTDGAVTLSGVPLRELDLAAVRDRILVADNDAVLFSGPLREAVATGGGTDDGRIRAALHTASATDIVDALPGGLDAFVAERGREFSGGQQQRLRLARALLADPPILVLVEPTSAVDAHTEARIAQRLAAARHGRTTVVCTTSPLVLDRVDHVLYVEDGKVVAEGGHRALLDAEPRYAATVTRGEDL